MQKLSKSAERHKTKIGTTTVHYPRTMLLTQGMKDIIQAAIQAKQAQTRQKVTHVYINEDVNNKDKPLFSIVYRFRTEKKH